MTQDPKTEQFLTQPQGFHFIWNPFGYQQLQKFAKYKNQDPSREYAETVAPRSPQFAAYLKLARRIRFFPTFSVTADQKHTDRALVEFLCDNIVATFKQTRGYELFRKLPDDLSGNILPIFSELIINAQKAIFSELLKERIVQSTVKKAYYDRGLQPPKYESTWVQDDKVRLILSLIAKKMQMTISSYFDFTPNYVGFAVQNNCFLNYQTLKLLDDRTQTDISQNLAETFQELEGTAGAGIGLILARQSIQQVAQEHNFYWDLHPVKTDTRIAIMQVDMRLDMKYDESPKLQD